MGYNLVFTDKAKEDTKDHQRVGNKAILAKLLKLLEELSEHPYTGTGKPEALKYDLAGCWSRRITKEHRLVYQVLDDNIIVLSAKGHY
jgi:toxin YoeB